ncbi:hypothetical protein BDV95DRAFT_638206 [Massariosphaeria phaeospora]|uniref:Uncharacterized protein n=1 Tax=Massariosphaeria phaeospora TaxID=100035 RepID=A0A7C8I4C1_9PLEO|nr:hypothetical protein BDV95DRAFT_638206 [Massariosphaeria phaeospora]
MERNTMESNPLETAAPATPTRSPRSIPTSSQQTPPPRPVEQPPPPKGNHYVLDKDAEPEEKPEVLEKRVRAAITYTKGEILEDRMPLTWSNCSVPRSAPYSAVLSLLRESATEGVTKRVLISPDTEVYSIGIPPAKKALDALDGQWWEEGTRAEVGAKSFRIPADDKNEKRLDKSDEQMQGRKG